MKGLYFNLFIVVIIVSTLQIRIVNRNIVIRIVIITLNWSSLKRSTYKYCYPIKQKIIENTVTIN